MLTDCKIRMEKSFKFFDECQEAVTENFFFAKNN